MPLSKPSVHSTDQENTPTLERPLALLAHFSEDRLEWGLSDIAAQSGIPKASCLRALNALVRYGLLVKVESRYRLGPKLLTLGSLVQNNYPARQVAHPYLSALRERTGQSVQWVVRDDLEGVYLDVLESSEKVRLFIAPGRRAPLYAGASTRLLLSFAPADILQKVFVNRRRRYTETTPVEGPRLRRLVRFSARHWISLSYGELSKYSAEVACPVFASDGHIVAAVSVAGAEPAYRDVATLARFIDGLLECAHDISLALGFPGEWQPAPESGRDLARLLVELAAS